MVLLKSSKASFKRLKEGRVNRPFLYAILLCLPAAGYAQSDTQLTFSFESFNYSDSTSLHSILGHWSDEVGGGSKALSVSRIMLGFEYNNYSLQTVYRDDSYYNFDNETVHFIYLTENKLPLVNGQEYDLYIKPDKSSSEGLRFGTNQQITPKLKLHGFFSLLKATNLTHGNLNGHAMAVGSNDYDFNFASDLYYEDDPLFDRVTDRLSGKGYSIDLMLDYEINDKWSINLELLDVVGELLIDQAAFTRAEATSDIKVFDENGYLTYDPVISGLESNKDFVYQFNMQTHFSVNYKISDKNSLVLEYHRLLDFDYQNLILSQQLGLNQLSWILIPELETVGIEFKHPSFSIGLETDNLDYKKMKYFSLNTQLFWAF
ncbi:MAG: hypothetical protein HOB14_19815 [Gammaproteobacteria bacterium]|jgi:hypothetical protein|nr:hypothetical protein [Gammaproteobacteria bacterium]MBT6703908.1 hypothetical protein [Gammaproteobacteria bacterium]